MSGFTITEPGGRVYDHAAQQKKNVDKQNRRHLQLQANVARLDNEILQAGIGISDAYKQFALGKLPWLECFTLAEELAKKRTDMAREREANLQRLSKLRVDNPLLGATSAD